MPQFDSNFYEFYLTPDTCSIPDAAARAKRYGFSRMVIVGHKHDKETRLPDGFYRGMEIQAKPSRMREEIRKFRDSDNILIVRGGDEETARAAAESEGLDILLQPAGINNVIAQAASDNSVAIGFDLGVLIRLRGEARIRELHNMRINLRHARKYEISMILTCYPHSVHDLRSPREMAALSGVFGMMQDEAVRAIATTPHDILRRKSREYIREGIEII